jgi:pimeloyl-ACP methyl ester carboxylesterase
MPYAANGRDGAQVYFEDQGGDGAAVILHDGFADSVQDLHEWLLADALASEGFRLIFADHRGHGRSDKPHDPAAYAMPLRVGDAIAILDLLGIERAHFVGRSWGGRLCFGIGEHAPGRVRSLVIGGNQPYVWPDSPISRAVGEALAAAREQVSSEPLVRAFEAFWDIEFPGPQRERLLDNDPVALYAAWRAAGGAGDPRRGAARARGGGPLCRAHESGRDPHRRRAHDHPPSRMSIRPDVDSAIADGARAPGGCGQPRRKR